MKRLILLVLLAPLFLFNCFIFDVGTRWGKSLLTLNNLPPDVAQVHVISYEGYPQGSSNFIDVTTLSPGSTMSLTVPVGELRYFLIVAENFSGEANYTGVSGPYSISETGTVNVVVAMDPISITPILILTPMGAPDYIRWGAITGVDYYTMLTALLVDDPKTLYGITPLTILDDPPPGANFFWVRGYFSVLDIYTIISDPPLAI